MNKKSNLLKIYLFFILFFLSSLISVVNAQVFTNLNVKCNCTTTFSACGTYFNKTNVKRRSCTLAVNGAQTCTYATNNPRTLWQVVACSGISPTITGSISPTINIACICNSATNSCSNQCNFNKITAITTYNNPIKCQSLLATKYQSAPTVNQKNDWCRRPNRTKGDADGNDAVNFLDYFYIVSITAGGKIPANVNPDFNGDGVVNNEDRAVFIKAHK